MSNFYLQFKEFLGTYNKLTENCFVDCIKDFTSRDVKPEEVGDGFSWPFGRTAVQDSNFRREL